jgi:hypothetical protein
MTEVEPKVGRLMVRANKALLAAKTLLENQLYEDCISRAYYAVLHAAKAALVTLRVEPQSHRAVRRMFGLHFVKTKKVEKDFPVILAAEQEDRQISDYVIDIDKREALSKTSTACLAATTLQAERFVESQRPLSTLPNVESEMFCNNSSSTESL